MPDTSPRLQLPYLQPSQAQKHVTHNEALQRLDVLTQMTVVSLEAEVPPSEPAAGDIHALGGAPTLAWAGQEGKLAFWDGTAWQFLAPQTGWRAHDLASQRAHVYNGTTWVPEVNGLQNADQVGVGTTANATNRLAVASEASLFTHAGAGHQLKINKAAAGDTASLLFQSDWTGHAEMGLAGDTAFSIKTSANGSSWSEPLRLDAGAGTIALSPAASVRAELSDSALQVDVPLTGSAVQSDAYDETAGRVMKVGGFGLGAELSDLSGDVFANGNKTGFYYARPAANAGASDTPADGDWHVLKSMHQSGEAAALAIPQDSAANADAWWTTQHGGAAGAWRRMFDTGNAVGTVSSAGGVPTGALIESGSNANGDYMRFADGTQICWYLKLLTTEPVQTAAGPLFVANLQNWTYPAAFASVSPRVSGMGRRSNSSVVAGVSIRNITQYACDYLFWLSESSAANSGFRGAYVTAIGRWM